MHIMLPLGLGTFIMIIVLKFLKAYNKSHA